MRSTQTIPAPTQPKTASVFATTKADLPSVLSDELSVIRQQLAENTVRLEHAERQIENADWCLEYAQNRIEAGRRAVRAAWTVSCFAMAAAFVAVFFGLQANKTPPSVATKVVPNVAQTASLTPTLLLLAKGLR